MLVDEFISVLNARNREELRREIIDFTKRLGFETVDAMAVVDHLQGESEFIGVTNAPVGYREASITVDDGRRDPVMQHCKRVSLPIIWTQDTYTSVGQGDMWEEQARFGYRTGITLAFHLPKGRHFCIGVDRDQPLPSSRPEVSRMVAELHLFAAHAQDAALRVLLPPYEVDVPDLTPRELESLRWTMEGKTAWEVGRILAISEPTAARHINNATRKLGCVNKLQAVLKALRMDLI